MADLTDLPYSVSRSEHVLRRSTDWKYSSAQFRARAPLADHTILFEIQYICHNILSLNWLKSTMARITIVCENFLNKSF